MTYLWQQLEDGDIDDPVEVWRELDGASREVRRIELYPGGQMAACGEERGNADALSPDPVDPADLDGEVHPIGASVFAEAWRASQERPDALMGMFL